jgi:hypothetical protein
LVAVPVVLLFAAGAQAGAARQVTLAASAAKVLYGHALTLSGTVVGGGSRTTVTLLAWPYGRRAPRWW